LKPVLRFLSSEYGLFVHFTILCAILSLILYKPVIQFRTLDSAPEHVANNSHSVPEVEVGLALENFAEFDILHNRFIAEGIVWFLYDDPVSISSLEKFSFNKGSIIEKSAPIITMAHGKKMARFHVRFSFTTSLSYRNFPLDDHSISIELKNDSLTASDLKFVSKKENFSQSVDVEMAGWTLVDHQVQAGYGKTVLRHGKDQEVILIPHVIFSLDYDRSGLHLVVIILLPLLMLFFAALAVFLIRVPSLFDASSTFMGSVFALIGYLFVVETISPQVGYMMLSNYMYLSVLVCTFVIAMLGWNANSLSNVMRGFIGTFVELLLVTLLFYFILVWRG
jgi:hypothetical protein